MRRKIWEDMKTQCSIIGTCLCHKELLKICRRHNVTLSKEAGEFEVHGTVVELCSKPGLEAKDVNKVLDRKYAGAVRRFGGMETGEAILELWGRALEAGDIPGPYWAVMTHPGATVEIRARAFGDVHMLSHLVGASNRADIRRLQALEEENSAARERHAKAKQEYRKRLRRLEEEKRELGGRLAETAKEAESLRFQAKKHGNEVLYRENQALHGSLDVLSRQAGELRARCDFLAKTLQERERRFGELEEELREKREEVAFLEQELSGFPGSCLGPCREGDCETCPGKALCGKRILYVGGRANLVRHYKEVVERLGGEFVHHDGGVEHSRQVLPKLVHGVDAVCCPVDCVSHDACQCVKDICKHTLKPCKMLRSSGLSSLARCLEELEEQPGM